MIDTDMNFRIEAACAEINGRLTVWTPEHVIFRLVEAFGILARIPMRIGPAPGGNAWPEFRGIEVFSSDELRDLLAMDHTMYRAAMAENDEVRNARIADLRTQADKAEVPTSDEVSRMEQALAWCLEHLQGHPLAADALGLYCKATALHVPLAAILRKRCAFVDDDLDRRRELLAEDRRDRMIQQELRKRTQRADPMVLRRQTEDDSRRAQDRGRIVAAALADVQVRLASVLEAARASEIETARAKLKRELPKGEKVTRASVWPDKVFTRRALDAQRKIGAALVAKALTRARIEVR